MIFFWWKFKIMVLRVVLTFFCLGKFNYMENLNKIKHLIAKENSK